MSDNAEDVVRSFLAAYNAHDLDAVAGLFALDAVYDDKGVGRVYEGRNDVVASIDMAFSAAPDCRWDLRSIIAAGDRVAFEGTWSGTVAEGALSESSPAFSANIDAATIVETSDGLIDRLTDYHSYSGPTG